MVIPFVALKTKLVKPINSTLNSINNVIDKTVIRERKIKWDNDVVYKIETSYAKNGYCNDRGY